MRSFLLCGVSQCLDLRKTAPSTGRSFCICTPMRIFWSFCGYAQISPLWSLCGRTQNRSTKFLRMHANKKKRLMEFLWICADYFSVEFLRPYAKSSAPLLGICVFMQINNFWSFCGYAQPLEPEKVTFAPTIRRSSKIGVSASVRKKAPRLY